MLKVGRRLGLALALLLWASLGATQDYQFKPAVAMDDISEKLLTDISRAGNRLVAVGERGLIIYSDDDGGSWTQAEVPVSATLTAVDFPTPELGWAVGHAGTIVHSSDGGATWSLQFDGNEANRQWLALASKRREQLQARVDALRAGEDDVAGETEADAEVNLADLEYDLEDAVFNEEDAQAAIETGPADPMLDVLFTGASEGWAVGAYGMIYHTTDAGTDWQLAAEHVDNPDRYHLYAMSHDGAGNIYLSGEAGLLYHSHDNGTSWVRNDGVYIGSLFGLVVRVDSVYAFGLRGNIFRSDDAGVSWRPITNPTQFSLYGGNALKDGRILLVGAGGGVLTLGAEDQLSTAIQSSRATLSGLAENRNGQAVLVGMDGVEFEESDSE